MKKLRICLEINGLAEDENGNPCPGGVCLTINGDCKEEITGTEHERLMKSVNVEAVLKEICLDNMFSVKDCRLLTLEEYDRKYEREDIK